MISLFFTATILTPRKMNGQTREKTLRIFDFVREDTEHRKLLIGNHDWSYLSQSREGQNCSGHQSGSIYSEGKITVIRELLLGARDILELAFECDGWVFSHAGFSKTV